jgi:hypothetical protein
MKSKPQKKKLSNQKYQQERKRLALHHIIETLTEIERYPRSYGFPMDLLAFGIGKTLDRLEGLADKFALKALTKLKDHNKGSKH